MTVQVERDELMAKAEGHKNRGESNQQMAHKLQQAQAEIIVLK
jgi:hypothetical protein